MAITKITAPSSIPATVADYQAQNSHLMAFINQINSQAFILSDPNGTVAPTIKQGAYISHGGSLYIVDTVDATISGTPSDGTVYIRVSGTDTLTAEYVTDISSYAWNSAYNAMISGSYTLLPYMLIKSGTSYTKYRFEQHKQATGNAIIDGHNIDSELDTLNSRVNQGVKNTDSPTFADIKFPTVSSGTNKLFYDRSSRVYVGNTNTALRWVSPFNGIIKLSFSFWSDGSGICTVKTDVSGNLLYTDTNSATTHITVSHDLTVTYGDIITVTMTSSSGWVDIDELNLSINEVLSNMLKWAVRVNT